MKNKNFDCVALMRTARNKINSDIIDMSSEEVVEYFISNNVKKEYKHPELYNSSTSDNKITVGA
jgi:hypothetical protein